MLTLIRKLFRRLFPARRIIQTCGKIETTVAEGRSDWVLGRGLCHFDCINLSALPRGQRVDALQVRVLQWSPFAETGVCVIWNRGYAQVWIWNKETWQAERERLAVDPSIPLLPESLLYPARVGDTIQLRPCLEGFEGLCWRAGILQASRWWAERPSSIQWSGFLRAASTTPGAAVEVLEAEPLMDKPWAKPGRLSRVLEHRYERILVRGALLLFAAILGWQGMMLWKWVRAERQLTEQADRLSVKIEPLLTARRQAVADRLLVEKYQRLAPYPSQLKLEEEVVSRLNKMGKHRLMGWHYTLGRLRFIIQGEGLDPSRVVRSFQSIPWFQDVGVEPGNRPQQLVVNVKLKPRKTT